MEYTPKSWQDIAAIIGIVTALGALMRWMINDITRRITDRLEIIEAQMDKLGDTYAKKEVVNLQFDELRREQVRTNDTMTTMKDELKTSIHNVANNVTSVLREALLHNDTK